MPQNRTKIFIIITFLLSIYTSLFAENSHTKYCADSLLVDKYNSQFKEIFFSNPDSAVALLKKSIEIAQKNKYQRGFAFALNNMGFYHFYTGNPQTALGYYFKALDIFNAIKEKQGIASCLNHIGLLYLNQGDYAKAIDAFLKSLSVAEELNDKIPQAKTLNNIGNVYNLQGNYDEAIFFYKKSLQIFSAIPDSNGMAGCLNNIGMVLKEKKELSNALHFFEKAIAIAEKIKNLSTLAEALHNAGLIYYEYRDYDKATELLMQSYQIEYYLGNARGAALSLINIAQVFYAEKKLDYAKKYFEDAMAIAIKIDDKETKKYVYIGLSNIYYDKGNYLKAYDWLMKYMQVKDSLLNEKMGQDIAEIRTKYEVDNKNKEIDLLKKDKELQELKIKENQYKTLIISIVLIAFVVLSLLILYGYHNKQKTIHLLNIQNAEITLQKEEINAQKDHLEHLNSELIQQKEEILAQKEEIQNKSIGLNQALKIIETKNKHITHSITYALRIQKSMLPPMAMIKKWFPDSFVLFKPKDIVSGDFYWFSEHNEKIIFAAIDCTGHGVPGAFMSIIGHNLLKQAIIEHRLTNPAEILNFLFFEIKKTLALSGQENSVGDGMDIALCSLNRNNLELQFSGVLMPLLIVRDNEIMEYKGDGYPIDNNTKIVFSSYKNYNIKLQKGDTIYLQSDGYTDQFNKADKKYSMKQLRDLLLEIQNLTMHEQQQMLEHSFEQWKGDCEQVDDVMIIGIKL